MKNLTSTLVSLLVAASLTARTIVFQDAFDGTVPNYDSPNDGGTPTDGSVAFSPIYFDGNDASVAPGIWQHTQQDFVDDLTLNQNKGRARAAAIVFSGPFSGLHTVSFDLVEINPNDTLYIGVYDVFNSDGNMINAYGLDVLANADPGAPAVSATTDWATQSTGVWGPVALGNATVTELAMFSIGGAEDNSALAGTAQSFTFNAGANDLMIFIGVGSSDAEGVRASLDNLTITEGEVVSGPTWAGYDVDELGDADTGAWLGVVNVDAAPWIWNYLLETWLYIPEDVVEEAGSWSFVPN
jgi:hypothetical protein